MPTYSYRCTKCSVEFDIQQAFSDASLTVCESCGGALRKLFSPVGVTFQGSGFYRTDSRAPERKTDSAATTSSSSTSSSSTGSSSTTTSSSAASTSSS